MGTNTHTLTRTSSRVPFSRLNTFGKANNRHRTVRQNGWYFVWTHWAFFFGLSSFLQVPQESVEFGSAAVQHHHNISQRGPIDAVAHHRQVSTNRRGALFKIKAYTWRMTIKPTFRHTPFLLICGDRFVSVYF